MERKKWKEFDLHVQSSDDYRSDLTITAETENPDAEFELGTLSSFNLQTVQESVTLSGFPDAAVNGIYTFDREFNTGSPNPGRIYSKGSLLLKSYLPDSPYLEVEDESGSTIYAAFNISSLSLPDGSFVDVESDPVSGSSTYTQGGESLPTTLAEGEDVSIRGRIGNRRGYGLQFTFNNTTGRPRIRAIEADGSASFRSTTTAD
jgi:hypothetical protein